MACHLKHGQQTRPSFSTCHPRFSNCGIAVDTTDTSFKDEASKHSLHSVKYIDCHAKVCHGRGAKCSSGDERVAEGRGARKVTLYHFGNQVFGAQVSLRTVMNVTQFCAK